jgi:hypothetical protein
VNHHTASSFWECYERLPLGLQRNADAKFLLLKSNANHPSLQFKPVGKHWSARVSQGYRALALQVEDGYLWFWIGNHDEYEKIIAAGLRR